MAVQAQYASNVLLLNRNTQEKGHDYSLQPQPEGIFQLDHQSHMLFNTGGTITNPRKRGREISGSTANEITAPNFSPFSLNQQYNQPQLIELSQLHNRPQPNAVSTGLRLSSGDQQRYHHLQQLQQKQQEQNNNNLLLRQSSPSTFSSQLSEDFSSHFKQQRDELDQFLQAQGEELRRTLVSKTQRHYHALISAAEEIVARRLGDKDAEVEKATRRNAELEARLAQLSTEAQAWQAKARAQEAAAASLQSQLQQVTMRRGAQDKMGGYVEGLEYAGGVDGQAEDAESGYIDPDRVTVSGPSCKACEKRVASVVLLPCRHLCVCTECDQVVQACPLCLSFRNSSVEVFLS